jgi:hypothetical protein
MMVVLFGPVPAVEEDLRVRVLVRHVLDVLQEAHRGVLVGVRVKAASRCTSNSFCIGLALFLLYSPSTARDSVLNASTG